MYSSPVSSHRNSSGMILLYRGISLPLFLDSVSETNCFSPTLSKFLPYIGLVHESPHLLACTSTPTHTHLCSSPIIYSAWCKNIIYIRIPLWYDVIQNHMYPTVHHLLSAQLFPSRCRPQRMYECTNREGMVLILL